MQTKEWGNLFTTPPQSYWMASVDIPQYEQLAGNIGVDVVVVGGGIVGITSAFLLKQAALR